MRARYYGPTRDTPPCEYNAWDTARLLDLGAVHLCIGRRPAVSCLGRPGGRCKLKLQVRINTKERFDKFMFLKVSEKNISHQKHQTLRLLCVWQIFLPYHLPVQAGKSLSLSGTNACSCAADRCGNWTCPAAGVGAGLRHLVWQIGTTTIWRGRLCSFNFGCLIRYSLLGTSP